MSERIGFFDRDAIVLLFAEECTERLTEMEQCILALEQSPQDDGSIQTILRAAHTIKGNAAALGFPWLQDAAHVVEDLLYCVRSQRVPVSRDLVSLLIETREALQLMVAEAIAGAATAPTAPRTVIDRVAAAAAAARSRSTKPSADT